MYIFFFFVFASIDTISDVMIKTYGKITNKYSISMLKRDCVK